jgi:DNA transformation protein
MSEFVKFLPETFSSFGAISIRKMFGGHGVFHEDIMIGLIADDTLYLKTDKQSAQQFIDQDLPQFTYPKANRLVGMSYYQAPAEALEDPDEMRHWAQLAFDAALRSRR